MLEKKSKTIQEKSYLRIADNDSYVAYCPACDVSHELTSDMVFNGNMQKPTFEKMLIVNYPTTMGMQVCHSQLTDGKWHYQNDCTRHSHSGKTLDMVEIT